LVLSMKWRKVAEFEKLCIDFKKVQGPSLQCIREKLQRLREDYTGFETVQGPYIRTLGG